MKKSKEKLKSVFSVSSDIRKINIGDIQSMMVNTGKYGVARQSTFEDINDEEFTKMLHFSIWPVEDFAKFQDMVEKRPPSLHWRFGFKQETMLHRACRYGNAKVFNYLLSHGAVLEARNKVGATPLHLACQFARIQMTKDLIKAGVSTEERDDDGDQAIHYAAKAGSVETINLLVDSGVFKCVSGHRGNTIIHYAAMGGELGVIDHIIGREYMPVINRQNDLSETPLHLAAGCFTKSHGFGVDLIKYLLDYGANLNATTVWGDTAVHYAARHGSPFVFKLLIERGIEVAKPFGGSFEAFFEKHGIPEEDRVDFEMTLLQKVAKSTCIIKSKIILDEIMNARNKMACNMYFGDRGVDVKTAEMSRQESSFLNMSHELSEVSDPNGAVQMFLKFSPDSLKVLFDRCIIKPCHAQVQGRIYFDFVLFNNCLDACGSSELNIINTLIASGKERFLIHPIFEVFLKLKWYKTWIFYLTYILTYFIFVVALGGYTLAHFGKLYRDQWTYDYRQKNGWWYFLASMHAYISITTFFKSIQIFSVIAKTAKQAHNTRRKIWSGLFHWNSVIERYLSFASSIVKENIMPVLVGVIIYGNLAEHNIRYLLSFAIILTCYHFMHVISRLPRIGLYVHMLNKVMVTVLNFFSSYVWHFLGYAIAFHILLPNSRPFGYFFDAFVKVMTMLMGEYDYTLYFVANDENEPGSENPPFMAKIIFVMFLVDMSVVLMNLVLGLAIADIEELQRNSAVRRMMQETCAVMFMENIFEVFGKMCFCEKLWTSRITTERTSLFQDVIFLDLVDIDKNPNNVLTLDRASPSKTTYYSCPHHIVTNVAKIVKEQILAEKLFEDPEKSEKHQGIAELRENQEKLQKSVEDIKAILEEQRRDRKRTEFAGRKIVPLVKDTTVT